MIPIIYDQPEDRGIVLSFDFENGMSLNFFMEDENALEMINIIENKLNARL